MRRPGCMERKATEPGMVEAEMDREGDEGLQRCTLTISAFEDLSTSRGWRSPSG